MVNVDYINKERLDRWKVKLNRYHSTPILLVGVGHDHVSGRLVTLTTEERTDEEIVLLLKEALKQLEQGNIQK